MKKARRRIDVNLDELDRVLDGAREAPLSESDHGKLRDALHALAELLVRTRNTEKTSAVVGKQEGPQTGTHPDNNATPPPGHGRNGAEAFGRSEEHTSELQSLRHLVCRLLLEKKKNIKTPYQHISCTSRVTSVSSLAHCT